LIPYAGKPVSMIFYLDPAIAGMTMSKLFDLSWVQIWQAVENRIATMMNAGVGKIRPWHRSPISSIPVFDSLLALC